MQKVVGLEELVVELQKVQPSLAVVASPVTLSSQHAIDAKMPANVPQKLQIVERPEPVGVVEHQRLAGREIQKVGHLLLQVDQVGIDPFHRQKPAHFILVGGIANHARSAAHEGDGPVPVALHVGQGHDRYQMPHMETGRTGIKSDVADDGLFYCGPDPVCIRCLFDKAPLCQYVE